MPPKKPKLSVNFDPKKFSTNYSLFLIESNIVIQEAEQQDSINEEIKSEISGFFAAKNLNAETGMDKILN